MKHTHMVLLFLFLILIFSFTFTTSLDFNQDLGRHLKLGEIITTTRTIPKTNLFSFTNPAFPFVNHHWLSEVIFYMLSSLFKLPILIILKTTLIIVSVYLVLKISIEKSGFFSSLTAALILVPFILERNTIRPEIFGFFFFAAMFSLLYAYPRHRFLLFFIPLIMILWVNIHISFVFGVVLLGVFTVKEFRNFRSIALPLFLSFLALFVNPQGIQGALYPALIFKNYGYTIAENQNLFFLSTLTSNPLIAYFFLLAPFFLFCFFVLIAQKKYLEGFVFFAFSLLVVFQIRHMPFFVLSAIPAISSAIHVFLRKIRVSETVKTLVPLILFFTMVAAIFFFSTNTYAKTFDRDQQFGIGFQEYGKEAIDFLKKNRLPPSVFNNFDIGGYMIYALYPDYSFFVDNRPEAYPADFLRDVYIRLQTDRLIQKQVFDQYGIRTVFFTHTDQTQWARVFLETMYQDHTWKLVYVDRAIVIFTKEANTADIRDDQVYFKNLIEREENYLHLLRLSTLFQVFQKKELSKQAFVKAQKLNPLSCTISKITAAKYQGRKFWYCY